MPKMLDAIDCIYAIYGTTALTSTFCSRTKKVSAPVLRPGTMVSADGFLSAQNCCNFTVAAPLLGFTESPNSIASAGRQPPSRQLHGLREGNLPIAGPWDAEGWTLDKTGIAHTAPATPGRREDVTQGAALARKV